MTYSKTPLIANLKKVTGLTSESLREQMEIYSRRFPKDLEGNALLLHIVHNQNDRTAEHQLISHLKEYHCLE